MGIRKRLRRRGGSNAEDLGAEPEPDVGSGASDVRDRVLGRAEPAVREASFGTPGEMDDDGFSAPASYAQKAETERELLQSLEQRLRHARLVEDHNTVAATEAYIEDLSARIAHFERLALEDA